MFYVISYHWSCCTGLEYRFFSTGKTSVEVSSFVSPRGGGGGGRPGDSEYKGTESFVISENYCFPHFLGSR